MCILKLSCIYRDQQKVIQDLYIKAALRQPVDIDYEVQCGLGVLFNLSGDYEKAADCFRTALSVKYDVIVSLSLFLL
jgi:peroxin-5